MSCHLSTFNWCPWSEYFYHFHLFKIHFQRVIISFLIIIVFINYYFNSYGSAKIGQYTGILVPLFLLFHLSFFFSSTLLPYTFPSLPSSLPSFSFFPLLLNNNVITASIRSSGINPGSPMGRSFR